MSNAAPAPNKKQEIIQMFSLLQKTYPGLKRPEIGSSVDVRGGPPHRAQGWIRWCTEDMTELIFGTKKQAEAKVCEEFWKKYNKAKVREMVKSYMEDIQKLPEFLGSSSRYARSIKPNAIYVFLDLESSLEAQESLEEIIKNSGAGPLKDQHFFKKITGYCTTADSSPKDTSIKSFVELKRCLKIDGIDNSKIIQCQMAIDLGRASRDTEESKQMYLVISDDSAFMYTLQTTLKGTILLHHIDDTSVSAITREVNQMDKIASPDPEPQALHNASDGVKPEDAPKVPDPGLKINLINSPGTMAADAEYNWKKNSLLSILGLCKSQAKLEKGMVVDDHRVDPPLAAARGSGAQIRVKRERVDADVNDRAKVKRDDDDEPQQRSPPVPANCRTTIRFDEYDYDRLQPPVKKEGQHRDDDDTDRNANLGRYQGRQRQESGR